MLAKSTGRVKALCRPTTNRRRSRLYHAIEAAESAVERWRDEARRGVVAFRRRRDWPWTEAQGGRKKRSRRCPNGGVVGVNRALPGAIEIKRKQPLGAIEKAVKEAAGAGIVSKVGPRQGSKKAVEDAFARLTEGGAILEKGARWGVSVVRSDGSETVWMKGESDE